MILVPAVALLAAVLVWWVSREPGRAPVAVHAGERR
jgi:hypothetical protein